MPQRPAVLTLAKWPRDLSDYSGDNRNEIRNGRVSARAIMAIMHSKGGSSGRAREKKAEVCWLNHAARCVRKIRKDTFKVFWTHNCDHASA